MQQLVLEVVVGKVGHFGPRVGQKQDGKNIKNTGFICKKNRCFKPYYYTQQTPK